MSIEGWSNKKVKDICDLGRGRVISAQEIELNQGIYPVFSSQSQNMGEMGKINTYDFDGEYVTWTTDGAYAGTVFYRIGKFNCTNVCGTLKAKSAQVSMKFLAYNLSTLAKNHVSYIGNPKLMNNVMANIELSLPDITEEQTQIAAILSMIDRAIEQTEAIIAKQQRIKTGLMQDLLTKGIDEDGNVRSEATHEFKDSPLGRIPVEWDIEKIGDVFDMQLGKMLSQKASEGKSPFPYLGNKNIQWDYVDISELLEMDFNLDERQKFKLLENDILVCEGGEIGRTCLWRMELKDCYFQKAIHRLRPKRSRYYPSLFPHYMQHLVSRGILNNFTSQTSIAHLTKEKLITVPISVPRNDEQRRIVELFDQVDELLQNECRKLENLRLQKTGLMQDLLTGNVRVTDLLNYLPTPT